MSRSSAPSRDLFVFVGESGNFDLSPKGTSWYYTTVLSTFDPRFGLAGWHETKIAAVRAGIDLERLHATEDKQWVRDRVFALLGTAAAVLRVNAIRALISSDFDAFSHGTVRYY